VAAWAVALSVFLILVASASSRADTTGGAGVVPTSGSEDGGSQLLQSSSQPDALPGGAARKEVLARMSARAATWYGPGFYGRRTACGVWLRRATQGVAHRSLPCGTPVSFYHRGRLRTVAVIDRGPFVRGVVWDLTAATARSLDLRRKSPIRSLAWQRAGAAFSP
jgi:hypothetical protein